MDECELTEDSEEEDDASEAGERACIEAPAAAVVEHVACMDFGSR
jgi:hypothetical protein